MEPKLFVATKAFIEYKGKVLIVRESPQYKDGTQIGKYGEVGGRVHPGERFDESLIREAKEETGLDIIIEEPFFVTEWRPTVRGEAWQVVAIFFKCSTNSDRVTLSKDHDDFLWIDPTEYKKYDIMADLPPAFEAYIQS